MSRSIRRSSVTFEREWGLTIRDGFGQTETTALVGNTAGAPLKAGSMGRPLPGVPVVIVDPLTGELADEGEICLDLNATPVNLMTGYVDDDEKNAGRHRRWLLPHRRRRQPRRRRAHHLHRPHRRRVQVLGLQGLARSSSRACSSSIPRWPRRRWCPHPTRRGSRCPRPTSPWLPGGRPNEDTAFQILGHAREHLPPYLRVRRVEFYELPKTISGKIRRVELRAREQAAADSGQPIASEWRDDALTIGVTP